MPVRLLAILVALAALGTVAVVGFGSSSLPSADSPPAPTPAKVPELTHDWPASVGLRYPDLELRTIDGKPFDFSSLAGKVLLLETVGLQSPGSIGFAGIKRFGGQVAQGKLRSLDTLLAEHGIDRNHPDLRTVHLLFFDSMHKAPSLDRARLWAADTGLSERENAIVLVGDARYVKAATLRQVPGFQLVDRTMLLRMDAGGNAAPDNIYDDLLPELANMLGARPPAPKGIAAAVVVPAVPTDGDAARLLELLRAQDYAGADDAFAELRAQGRAPGRFARRAVVVLEQLSSFPGAAAYIDAWTSARPDSLGAHLLSGMRWIDRAWAARSGRIATKVRERGWKVFAERLTHAQRSFERAHAIDETYPIASAYMITVGTGQSWELERIRRYFDRAIAIDPMCMSAYGQLLWRLMPRWGGSFTEMVDLIKEAHERTKHDPAVEWLTARFHLDVAESSGLGVPYLDRPDIAKRLERSLQRVAVAYPKSPRPWTLRSEIERLRGDRADAVAARQQASELGASGDTRLLADDHRDVKDYRRAFELYALAAEQGCIEAFSSVGWCYVTGEGVLQDFDLARQWFEAGVACDDAMCMYGLGVLYERGNGVDVDLRKALDYYYAAGVSVRQGEQAAERLAKKHPELLPSGK